MRIKPLLVSLVAAGAAFGLAEAATITNVTVLSGEGDVADVFGVGLGDEVVGGYVASVVVLNNVDGGEAQLVIAETLTLGLGGLLEQDPVGGFAFDGAVIENTITCSLDTVGACDAITLPVASALSGDGLSLSDAEGVPDAGLLVVDGVLTARGDGLAPRPDDIDQDYRPLLRLSGFVVFERDGLRVRFDLVGEDADVVPLPGGLALFLAGAGALGTVRARRS